MQVGTVNIVSKVHSFLNEAVYIGLRYHKSFRVMIQCRGEFLNLHCNNFLCWSVPCTCLSFLEAFLLI